MCPIPVKRKPAKKPLSVLEERFKNLVELVQGCRACPRMEGRRRVLTNLNGRPGARVMFVAEAPGRHGADRTGVPIHGDATGVNFETLLASVGWKREDVFVTNAVLCNPRTEEGVNDKPSDDELHRCSFHLESTIRVVDPIVVVSLGGSALAALNLIEEHGLSLRTSVAKPTRWCGKILFPLYHQSPRALVHRSMSKQRADFQELARLVSFLEDR